MNTSPQWQSLPYSTRAKLQRERQTAIIQSSKTAINELRRKKRLLMVTTIMSDADSSTLEEVSECIARHFSHIETAQEIIDLIDNTTDEAPVQPMTQRPFYERASQ